MDWQKVLYPENEKPLERLVEGYSNTSVFRTIAFVGDSLSSGEIEIYKPNGKRGCYDLYDYSWGQYIARKNGLCAYNFSRGGMTAEQYIKSFAEEKGFWDPALSSQCYVIALGYNDIKEIEIGSIEDVDPEDYTKNKPTFLGYYAAIVQRYKKISPEARFFFVTLANESPNLNEENVLKMIRGLYDLAEYFDHSYVIDLYQYGPIYDENFKKKFFLNGHMNASGYIFTAKLIDSYIDYIVRQTPEEFQTVPLVGTDIKYLPEHYPELL